MSFVGLDIGGAHTKLATINGHFQQVTLPIWKEKDRLSEILQQLRDAIGPQDPVCLLYTSDAADE